MKVVEAAVELSMVLRLENDALERDDLVGAGTLLVRKQEAVRTFAELSGRRTLAPDALRDVIRELAVLADANRRLLDRAMAVQRQVIGLVARSATATAGTGRYARGGTPVAVAGPGRALASRA